MTGAGAAAPGPADRARLFSILSSPWVAQSCYALAKFGIPDLMADGPRAVADLASASGTDQRALHRMLRALAAAGLVRQTAPGTFELTPVAQPLRSSVARSSRDAAIMFGEEVFRSLADITYTLRTGQAFRQGLRSAVLRLPGRPPGCGADLFRRDGRGAGARGAGLV